MAERPALHLPCSSCEQDEFYDPSSNRWRYTFSTAAYDSWILWKDALPANHLLWPMLERADFLRIKRLAERLHQIHQVIGGESRLGDSPWVFRSWWQPGGDGGSCVFYMREVATDSFLAAARRISHKTKLVVEPLDDPWIRATLG